MPVHGATLRIRSLGTEALLKKLMAASEKSRGIEALAAIGYFIPTGEAADDDGFTLPVAPFPYPALRELIARGADAVPLLLEHLDDPTPTNITLAPGQRFGADEPQPIPRSVEHARRPIGLEIVERGNDSPQGMLTRTVPNYTLRLGDLCYFALGQIVNFDDPGQWMEPRDAWVRLRFYYVDTMKGFLTTLMARPPFDESGEDDLFWKLLKLKSASQQRQAIEAFKSTHDPEAVNDLAYRLFDYINLMEGRYDLAPEAPQSRKESLADAAEAQAVLRNLFPHFKPTLAGRQARIGLDRLEKLKSEAYLGFDDGLDGKEKQTSRRHPTPGLTCAPPSGLQKSLR